MTSSACPGSTPEKALRQATRGIEPRVWELRKGLEMTSCEPFFPLESQVVALRAATHGRHWEIHFSER